MKVQLRLVAWLFALSASCGTTPGPGPATPPPGPSAQKSAIVNSGVDPQLIASYVTSQLSPVRDCWRSSLRGNPKLEGRIVMRWTIDVDGVPRDVAVQSNTMPPSPMPDCLRAAIQAWRFPKPASGRAEVAFPFNFTLTDAPAGPRRGNDNVPN